MAPDAPQAVDPCVGQPGQTGDQTLTIESGGIEREFRLHVPASYGGDQPVPLVINFHGLGSNARQQEAYTSMSLKADEQGFLAVHPSGTSSSWNGGGCCGQAAANNVDDVGFVSDLIDAVSDRYCVDQSRVFATGMSNGGFMSHRLACELSDRIAAFAPVAGTNLARQCSPTRAVPVMHFHGTADSVVGYRGAPTTMSAWAARNGCDAKPSVSFQNGNATCETYSGCREDAEVILCSIEGLGHSWPNGLGAPADIDATDAMWDFFTRHPLPPLSP